MRKTCAKTKTKTKTKTTINIVYLVEICLATYDSNLYSQLSTLLTMNTFGFSTSLTNNIRNELNSQYVLLGE